MDSSWLRDFLELAERGNFSRAAELRNITQPAFSRRIRLLEDWVGAELIDRRSHPVVLTEAGREFLPHATNLLAKYEEARQAARAASEQASATLHFATTQVLSLTFFPGWLRTILSRTKLGAINLTADSLSSCENVMLQGASQFLLCHYYREMPWRLTEDNFTSVLIEVDRLIPVSAALPNGKPMFMLDGPCDRTLPFLAYETSAGLGRIFRSVFDIDTLTPTLQPVATSHLALLIGLALEGRGIAWVPESVVKREEEAGTLVAAGSARWSIPMEIRLFRPLATLSPSAEEFWTIACNMADRK